MKDIMESVVRLYQAGHRDDAHRMMVLASAAVRAKLDLSRHNIRQVRVASLDDHPERITCPWEPEEPTRCDVSKFPARWSELWNSEVTSTEMPRLRGASVYAFGWPNESTKIDENTAIFLDNTWLTTDLWWRFMIGVGNFVALHEDHVLVDILATSVATMPGKYTLIGSQRNWGHWTLDHLALVKFARMLPDASERKLVFGMLTPKQRECLKYAGVKDSEIVELQAREFCGSLTTFEDLVVMRGVPTRSRSEAVREWSHKIAAPTGPAYDKVYITRTDKRVVNKSEVDALFRSRGYEVISDLPSRPLREQMRILTRAKVIAISHGADVTCSATCNISATVIDLMPRLPGDHYSTDFILLAYGPRVIPVYSEHTVQGVETPVPYSLDDIARAIDAC